MARKEAKPVIIVALVIVLAAVLIFFFMRTMHTDEKFVENPNSVDGGKARLQRYKDTHGGELPPQMNGKGAPDSGRRPSQE